MNPLIRTKLRRLYILFSIALLIFLFGLSSKLVESVYSDGIYQFTSVIQRFISSNFPFALGDFLYALLIAFCLWSVFSALKKVYLRQIAGLAIFLQSVNFILILYIVFKLLWGLNYSRPSISYRLGIGNQKYTTKELILVGDFLIKRVNSIQGKLKAPGVKKQYTIAELESKSKYSYDRLARLNPFFTYRIPDVKPVIFSRLVTTIGIEGYYCPLSGEANVNMMLPAVELPFVTSHEISHELGIAREDEANLIGYLVSINSPDLYFQYSGYYNILRSVLFEIRIKSPEDFALLLKKINAGTLNDFKEEQEFWSKYNGEMSAYMGTALDKFLKMNNQKKGINSYQDIVIWVYNLHRSEILNISGKKPERLSPLIPGGSK